MAGAADNNDVVDDDMNADDNAPVADFLNMSDEDMANVDLSTLVSGKADDTKVDDASKSQEVDDQAKADDEAKAEDDKTDDVAGGAADASGQAVEDAAGKEGKAADGAAKVDAKDGKAAEVTDPKKEAQGDGKAKSGDEGAKDDSVAVDYEAGYKKLMAPFKANGREIAPKSPEDAVALMQMGANYNKKMAAIKPHMATLRMLENAGIKDDDLNYLIDLHKKDPAAINRLIVESKIDPLDLSADKASDYKPGNHKVSQVEVELDEVIDSLEGSDHKARTLEIAATKWDEASRREIVAKPQLLQVINGHMQSGIYDRVATAVENERMFGRLKGLSDLQAYQKVGDAIDAIGGFDDLLKGSSQSQSKSAPAAKTIVDPKLQQAEEDKLKDARRAAGAPKAGAQKAGVPADFSPLSMSDADFAKFKPT